MLVMFVIWVLFKRPARGAPARAWYNDLVDVKTVDLSRDEYTEGDQDSADNEQRMIRMKGSKRYLWKLYYWVA